MERSERNIKWMFLYSPIEDDDTEKLIMSDKTASPWDYLRLSNSRIEDTDNLIMLLAIREANMSWYRLDYAYIDFKINYCTEMPTELAVHRKVLAFPFGLNNEKDFFSLVTCSGYTDQRYTFGIILRPFHWTIWISILSCVLLLLATWVLQSSYWNFKSSVDNGISLLLGTFGYDISLMSYLKNSRFLCFFLL